MRFISELAFLADVRDIKAHITLPDGGNLELHISSAIQYGQTDPSAGVDPQVPRARIAARACQLAGYFKRSLPSAHRIAAGKDAVDQFGDGSVQVRRAILAFWHVMMRRGRIFLRKTPWHIPAMPGASVPFAAPGGVLYRSPAP